MNVHEQREATIKKIAEQYLGLETLKTRNLDRLDFQEHSVGAIKAALEAAYEAGRNVN